MLLRVKQTNRPGRKHNLTDLSDKLAVQSQSPDGDTLCRSPSSDQDVSVPGVVWSGIIWASINRKDRLGGSSDLDHSIPLACTNFMKGNPFQKP